jgi:hypothetical protein
MLATFNRAVSWPPYTINTVVTMVTVVTIDSVVTVVAVVTLILWSLLLL